MVKEARRQKSDHDIERKSDHNAERKIHYDAKRKTAHYAERKSAYDADDHNAEKKIHHDAKRMGDHDAAKRSNHNAERNSDHDAENHDAEKKSDNDETSSCDICFSVIKISAQKILNNILHWLKVKGTCQKVLIKDYGDHDKYILRIMKPSQSQVKPNDRSSLRYHDIYLDHTGVSRPQQYRPATQPWVIILSLLLLSTTSSATSMYKTIIMHMHACCPRKGVNVSYEERKLRTIIIIMCVFCGRNNAKGQRLFT